MDSEIASLESQVTELQGRLRALRANMLAAIDREYSFASAAGTITLRELFGDARRLLVVHNMGVACAYCEAYADGFNGVLTHLSRHCAFVVATPDPVEIQQETARTRGWRFRMISTAGTTFTEDMGFGNASDGWWPGISALEINDAGGIVRVGASSFEPGDAFSPIWPALQLFDADPAAWPVGS